MQKHPQCVQDEAEFYSHPVEGFAGPFERRSGQAMGDCCVKMIAVVFHRVGVHSELNRQIPEDALSQCREMTALDHVQENDAFVEKAKAAYDYLEWLGLVHQLVKVSLERVQEWRRKSLLQRDVWRYMQARACTVFLEDLYLQSSHIIAYWVANQDHVAEAAAFSSPVDSPSGMRQAASNCAEGSSQILQSWRLTNLATRLAIIAMRPADVHMTILCRVCVARHERPT